MIKRTTLGQGLLNYAALLHLAPDIPLCKSKALVSTLKANLGVIEPLLFAFSHCGHIGYISTLLFTITHHLIGILR